MTFRLHFRRRERRLYADGHILQKVHSTFRIVFIIPFRLFGSQIRQVIVSVHLAGHTQVQMKQPLFIVAVAAKRMRKRGRLGRHQHWPSLGQFPFQHQLPFGIGIEIAVTHLHSLVITEKAGQCLGLADGIGATCIHTILHVHQNAAIAQQGCHRHQFC